MKRCGKIEDRQSLWSSQIHQLSAVIMSCCGFLFAMRVEKNLTFTCNTCVPSMNLAAKKPFLFSTSSRLLKELSSVQHFSVADLCTRSAKQEQRICKQPKSPRTALSIFVLYQCLHRSRVKETSIWIAQDKINFLILSSLSTSSVNSLSLSISHELGISLGKCIKHFYALNVQIDCLYIII